MLAVDILPHGCEEVGVCGGKQCSGQDVLVFASIASGGSGPADHLMSPIDRRLCGCCDPLICVLGSSSIFYSFISVFVCGAVRRVGVKLCLRVRG